jgi:hypothetical protein
VRIKQLDRDLASLRDDKQRLREQTTTALAHLQTMLKIIGDKSFLPWPEMVAVRQAVQFMKNAEEDG